MIPSSLLENLDCMYHKTLDEHAKLLKDFLFSDSCKTADCGTVRDLYLYAKGLARAMRARIGGRIDDALKMENRLEQIYNRLPKHARW